jgi:glycosyltransferase involved in cell wall biosynthesis
VRFDLFLAFNFNRQMKILLFTESFRAGGKERRIIELLKHLTATGNYRFEIVLSNNIIHYDEVRKLNIPIHVIERKFTKKDPLLFIKFFRIAKKFKPDIIHVWGHMGAVYAVPTKILLGVPMINNEIMDCLGDKPLLGKGLVFRFSDRIISNSREGLRAYKAPLEKSNVIYNGFSFDRLKALEDPNVVRTRFGIRTPYVVGMVASFLIYKDYTTYIQSALEILKTRDDITFLCIGDGDDSMYRDGPAKAKPNHILFLGRQMQVESIMNICHVGVLASSSDHSAEGISNALMEFMALGKPVVATNNGGTPELIGDNEGGYLVKAYDPMELAAKIAYLLDNVEIRSSIGENAKKRIANRFSIDAMINSFKTEYDRVLKPD